MILGTSAQNTIGKLGDITQKQNETRLDYFVDFITS